MNFAQLSAAARDGELRFPGPTISEDAIFIAGLLAEAGVANLVIARWPLANNPNTGVMTDTPPPVVIRRTLLSRQSDLPGELGLLPDDCRLIAGPMMIWRRGDGLVAALLESPEAAGPNHAAAQNAPPKEPNR